MSPGPWHPPRRRRSCSAFALAGALLASAPGTAAAQVAGSQSAEPARAPAVTLVAALPAGSRIDVGRLGEAIGSELGVAVVHEPGASGGTLHVRQEGETVTVTFDGPAGRHDERRFVLEPGAGAAEHEVALVAVNVARDQAAAFRIAPAPTPAVSPATPTPAPEPSPATAPPSPPTAPQPQSPCERARAAGRRREPFGLDFAPFAGTSSFDGRPVRSVSIGALGALSGGVNGVAVSGLVNADGGPVCGAEVAGLVNVAGGVEGVQIGGLASVASESSFGLQMGLVDVAPRGLRGAQLGLVSVAQDTNVQVGLVNVASDADVQIGLFDVDLHGRLAFDAWSKPEAGTLLVGVKHGPSHSHTIYAFVMNAATGRPWAALGWGAHLTPARRLSVDIDLLQHVQLVSMATRPNQLSELRVLVGYELLPHVTAFGGPTFNVMVVGDSSRADAPGYASLLGSDPKTATRAWPGASLGLEIQ